MFCSLDAVRKGTSYLLATAVAATITLILGTPGVAGPLRSASGSITHFRVCSYSAFTLATKRCRVDQRRQPLLSNRFVCSASVSTKRPTTLNGQWTFDGKPLEIDHLKLRAGTTNVFLQWNLTWSLPLPGGDYGCRISLGSSTESAHFSSSGPTGDVVDLAACDSSTRSRETGSGSVNTTRAARTSSNRSPLSAAGCF